VTRLDALLAVTLLISGAARAEDAASILKQYDAVMGPRDFEAVAAMTAFRPDGSERTYEMRFLKSGADRFRIWFEAPANARGQELLRVEDNFWVYMPNLKRSVRLAARESFMGGDFNNADILRVDYSTDYDAAIKSETPDRWVLLLKSHNPSSAYDQIELAVHKGDYLPLEGHYFAASGKELRAAEFKDPTDFHGHKRPKTVAMKNLIESGRHSQMLLEDFKVLDPVPATKFVLTELGK
jgi:outer membrane lipoprotein-sorting protein